MEIRTKFNVGDKVHHIVFNTKIKQYVCDGVNYIRKIIIKTEGTSKGVEICITYSFVFGNINNYYDEQDCFATKEEAEKECERRNG